MSDSHEMSDSQTSDAGSASQNFQVDLAGLVELLSHWRSSQSSHR